MPFVLLGGLTWGWFAAPTIGDGSGLLWAALGSAGFGLFFYLEQTLVPLVAAVAERFRLGGVAVLAWEVGVVGGLVFLFTSVLGAPLIPAVAIALGIGMTYSLSMEYLIFGSGADHMLNLLGSGKGWHRARKPDYSYPDALAKRGDLEGAARIYREAIWRTRRDPVPYLRLARVQLRMGAHERALATLREALEVADLDPKQEAHLVRQTHEIYSVQLEDPARAAPDLARYLEGKPEGAHGEWARRELAYIKERIREES